MKELSVLLVGAFLLIGCGGVGATPPATQHASSPQGHSPLATDAASDEPVALLADAATPSTAQASALSRGESGEDSPAADAEVSISEAPAAAGTTPAATTTTLPATTSAYVPNALPSRATAAFPIQGDALEAMLDYLAGALGVEKSLLPVTSDTWIDSAAGAPCGGPIGGGRQDLRATIAREITIEHGSALYRFVATGSVAYLCRG